MADSTERSKLPVTVTKPTPYTFDLGLLLANDPNPLLLQGNLEDNLSATARDGAQALLNQLLSTCPIASTPTGVLLSLPPISTSLPREKPLPPPKAETTWERFARKKGIKAKTAAARQKMQYDEATGEWVPKWGYKGSNKGVENDWIVEVDEKREKERKEGAGTKGKGKGNGKGKREGEGEERSVRGDSRRERMERIKRGERKMRSNERRAGKPEGS